MASPPFSLNITSPANTDVAAVFPALDRSDKDVIQSWLLIQMNNQGHDNQTLIDGVGTTNGPVSPPTPAAGTAAIYYDANKVLQEYRGDTALVVQLSVPIASVLPFAGSSAPNGYVLAQGQSLATTGLYANLFAVIGYTYGGSGPNFSVPDLRARVPVGFDSSNGTGRMGAAQTGNITGGAGTLGATGGQENHTLITAELPTFTPSGSISIGGSQGLAGLVNSNGVGINAGIVTGGGGYTAGAYTVNGSSFSGTFTGNAVGSNQQHNTVQPSIILNYIIRAF